jgi:hypothetical protein
MRRKTNKQRKQCNGDLAHPASPSTWSGETSALSSVVKDDRQQ